MSEPKFKSGDCVYFQFEDEVKEYIVLRRLSERVPYLDDVGYIWYAVGINGRTFGERYMRHLTKLEKALK